jgi:hypothetical protein
MLSYKRAVTSGLCFLACFYALGTGHETAALFFMLLAIGVTL